MACDFRCIIPSHPMQRSHTHTKTVDSTSPACIMAAIRRLFRHFTRKSGRQERTAQTMGDQTSEITKGMSTLAVRDKAVDDVPYEVATFALS